MIRSLGRPRLLALGAIAGIATGAGLAVALPDATGTPTERPYSAHTLPLTKAGPRTARANVPPGAPFVVGSTTLSDPIADPAGGPAWVVRISGFGNYARGKRTTRGPATMWCGQLLRRVDGELGWIDAANTFRPVAVRAPDSDSPTLCVSEQRRARTFTQAFILLEGADTAAPRSLGGVVWGFSADHITAPRLTIDGHRVPVRASGRRSAIVAFQPPGRPLEHTLTVRLPEGRRQEAISQTMAQAGPRYVPTAARVVPGSEQILARAADPGGGPSWGVTSARRRDGQWCGPRSGQIIDRAVGSIDQRLGTFFRVSAVGGHGGCVGGRMVNPIAKRPVIAYPVAGWLIGRSPAASEHSTEAALRRQPGRAVLLGLTLPGVESVTVTSRTSVRTAQPGGPAHAFVFVYDTSGNFSPWGGAPQARAVVRYAGGRTRTMTITGAGD